MRRAAGALLFASLATGAFYYSLSLLVRPDKAIFATAAGLVAVVVCHIAFGPRTAYAAAVTVLGATMLFSAIVAFMVGRFYGLW